MVDTTFLFLVGTTLCLGFRSLLETYSVRELVTRLGLLVAVVFVALISLDFGVIQQGQHHAGGNGPEMSSQWASVNLPRGFGPAGMSLPPWNPYAVAQSPEWQQQQQQLLMMQQQQQLLQQPPGVGAGGVVPALNGDPAGAAAGYFPMQPPGMAGSYVPGDATMMRRPEPTK